MALHISSGPEKPANTQPQQWATEHILNRAPAPLMFPEAFKAKLTGATDEGQLK